MEDKEIKDNQNSEEMNDDVTIDPDGADESVISEEAVADTVKKLREKLKKATEEKQSYLDGWQRDKAEFLNARKRDGERMQETIKYANEGLIEGLLPVLESFDMAIGNKEAWEKVDKSWRTGVEYIYNQLKKTLEENGLTEINPIGQTFDPMRDEAVSFEKKDRADMSGKIIDVVQKGYSLNGKAVRAPKVKVAE